MYNGSGDQGSKLVCVQAMGSETNWKWLVELLGAHELGTTNLGNSLIQR